MKITQNNSRGKLVSTKSGRFIILQISGIAKVCSIMFVFGMIFLVDGIVVDVMDIITTHSHVTYEQEGNLIFKVVTGNQNHFEFK